MEIRSVAAAALLLLALIFTVVAIVVGGSVWLLILAALCVVGVAALSQIDRAGQEGQPLALVVLLGLVVLASLLLVRLVLGWTSGPAEGLAPSPSTAPPSSTRSPNLKTGQFETVGTEVRLRAGAATNTAILTVMLDYGTSLTLSCYTTGESILGDQYWYRASLGQTHGYVSGYWVNTGPDPAATLLPAC